MGSKSTIDPNLLFLFCQKFDIESQKQNLPNAPSILINTESSVSFLQRQRVPLSFILISSIKALEIKAV